MKGRATRVIIRKATPNDADSICELLFGLKTMYASCAETTVSEFHKHYFAGVCKALRSPSNLILVAEAQHGELAAFISMTRRHVMRLGGQVGVLEEIYVSPRFRRHGIGLCLWKEAIVILKNSGINTVEIVSALAHPGQRPFAKKIGYEWYSNIHRVWI